MKFIHSFLVIATLFVCGSFSITHISPATYDVTVTVTNIRNSKGRIQLQLYKTGQSFANEKPYKSYYVSKKAMKNKSVSYTISGLSKGTYGIALLDDENANKEMDYSWMMPSEGFGFSDYYHTAWSKPKFSQFKFYLTENKKVKIKIRYM